MFKKTYLAMLTASLLTGCFSTSDDDKNTIVDREGDQPRQYDMRIGILADTQGSGEAVSVNQLEGILDFYADNGITHVIAVGDVTNEASIAEYEDWTRLASRHEDMVFLPLMGNHETRNSDNNGRDRFRDYMSPLIDQIDGNIVHFDGGLGIGDDNYEFITYAATSGNTLMINISEATILLPGMLEWVTDQVEGRDASVDHVIISSHQPFAGPYRGGFAHSQADTLGSEFVKPWTDLMAKHDVIFLSGHDHQYSRSVLYTDTLAENGSHADSDFFHHIVAGNASEKSYYLRQGEFEQIQSWVMFRTTMQGRTLDANNRRDEWTDEMVARDELRPDQVQINASWITITDDLVEYEAYYDDLADSAEWLAGGGDWKLFDRFTNTKDRCDKVIFPTSVASVSVEAGLIDTNYQMSDCYSSSGTMARLLDGENNVYNRVDQGLEGADYMTGSKGPLYRNNLPKYLKHQAEITSGADNQSDRDYQVDGTKMMGFNHPKGFELSSGFAGLTTDVYWFPHTIDMKKLVSLNWSPAHQNTLSEVLDISGIQGQTGVYSNPVGYMLDITYDEGRPGTQIVEGGDPTRLDVQNKQPLDAALMRAKSPNRMHETRNMELDRDLRDGNLRADDFVIEFAVPAGLEADQVILAHLDSSNVWQPLLSDYQCLSSQEYNSAYMNTLPSDLQGKGCNEELIVGLYDGRFWAKVDFEGNFALVQR
ncbi:hypothetical protein BCU68_16195 [Vibrio sp. 10N.286.49.B3]|uniref:metallophosphoesterase family protein n=1 Tax=Vibrio sp. 10N.286.49.B3 TaxID=1880855 RepID=UPI000C82888E|nr:metallophosphoesterase [Vibrio sp. 10N.286.49.B3]PMH40599.1 hypothetical protein BCU68_16195 [Vibrio sp. 10N.286.49.B3]